MSNGDLKPGDLTPSENDLAQRLEVNRLTVRKAYQELVREGQFISVRGKGTFVAQPSHGNGSGEDHKTASSESSSGGRGKKSDVIVAIFPEMANIFPAMLSAIEPLATQDGFSIRFHLNDTFEKETQIVRMVIEQRPAGVLITPLRMAENQSIRNYRLLQESGIPFAMIGRPPFNIQCDAVYGDDVHAVYEAVERLVHAGHKRILHLTDSSNEKVAFEERREGYLEAVSDYLPDMEPIVLDAFLDPNWRHSVLDLMKQSNPLTAVVAIDDLLAVDTYHLVTGNNMSVPADLAIIGFNDTELCERLPVKLTSIGQQRSMMGRIAYTMLVENISGLSLDRPGSYWKHLVLPDRMHIRDSCGLKDR